MPRISEDRKREVVAAFQASFKRDNRSQIEEISLADLRDTDEMLGDRDINAGFRLALRNRIRELETTAALAEQRRHESHVRVWNLIVGAIAGILVTVAAMWLTK